MPDQIDPFDPLRAIDPDAVGALDRPRPGHPAVGRLRARLAPWVAWFGLQRLVLGAITVVGLVVVGWWLLRAPAPPTEAGLPFTTTSQAAPSSGAVTGPSPPAASPPAPPTVPATLVVHVAGAVVAPGLYELAGDARTADAVAAAGGAIAGSDVDALNLAAPLRDGERVYVPAEGETPPPLPAVGGPGSSVPLGPVDLNRATAAELDGLPGIGPATAQAIVAHREANGPFAAIDDLEQVRGIGPAKLATIRPLVTL